MFNPPVQVLLGLLAKSGTSTAPVITIFQLCQSREEPISILVCEEMDQASTKLLRQQRRL